MKLARSLCRAATALLGIAVLLAGFGTVPTDAATRARTSRAAEARPRPEQTTAAKGSTRQAPAGAARQAPAQPSGTSAQRSRAAQASQKAAPRRAGASPALASTGSQPENNALLADPAMRQLNLLARPFVDTPTPAREQALRQFAARNAGNSVGALAYLALGYTASQGRRYALAVDYLAAARAGDSPVRDYCDYYLAEARQQLGKHAEALELLNGFEERYPQSSLARRAIVARAESWIVTGRAGDAVNSLKLRLDLLKHPEADMVLARAYAAQGQVLAAAEAYRRVYFLYPNSDQADEAEREIARLSRQAQIPPAPIELRRQRAERLYEARRFTVAAAAYADLAEAASGAERDRALVTRLACIYHAGSAGRAYALLRLARFTDAEAEAQRLYWQSQCERRLSRDADFLATAGLIGERVPTSPWYEEALFSAGNYYWLEHDAEQAAKQYQKLYALFPAGKYAAQAHWRVGWKYYRAGDYQAARKQFEEHIFRYPQSPQLAAALFWLGRIAEDAGDQAVAPAYFSKVAGNFPQYFYGVLAQEKLKALGAQASSGNSRGQLAAVTASAGVPGELGRILNAVPLLRPPLAGVAPPADLFGHRRKVEALEAAALLGLAIEELQHANGDPAHTEYLTLELARLEHDRGRFLTAIQYIRRVYPNYFAYPFDDLDIETWRLLFPLPWWSEVRVNALRNGLDPYLVAALIRQESAFNPAAVSRANAYGLMQLLPKTARKLARSVGRSRINTRALLDPQINIELGTRYLRDMLDHYSGQLEPALAGYNAGPERVDLWLQQAKFREPAEFIESIPFTETREYVEALVRNAAVYRRVYGPTPPASPVSAQRAQRPTGQ
jgi:soluble lytic murein transglycosylase